MNRRSPPPPPTPHEFDLTRRGRLRFALPFQPQFPYHSWTSRENSQSRSSFRISFTQMNQSLATGGFLASQGTPVWHLPHPILGFNPTVRSLCKGRKWRCPCRSYRWPRGSGGCRRRILCDIRQPRCKDVRWLQSHIGDHADQPACRAPVGNQRAIQAKGAKARDECCVALRPITSPLDNAKSLIQSWR